MRNKFRIMVLMVCSSIVLSGCLNYSVNREFGDYYNSTKQRRFGMIRAFIEMIGSLM